MIAALTAILLSPIYAAEGIAWLAEHLSAMVMLIPDAIEGADHSYGYWRDGS